MFDKVTLQGKHVRLAPLSMEHLTALTQAVSDGELWQLFVTLVPSVNELKSFITDAEKEYQLGTSLAFATIDIASNQVIGSTRFMKADFNNQRTEIGFTFIAKTFQKTQINTEAKLLMLSHAFDTLKLNRVELLTDYLNTSSRSAILRLGAKEEGLLRNHMVMPDGRIRDSVIYSIISNEWPGVKQHLMSKLTPSIN